MKKINCSTLINIDAKIIEVEGTLNRGLANFSIVGLAQTSIQESKERVKSALISTGFKFPPRKIIINLSPSDIKKEGSHFDLPIALLIVLNDVKLSFEDFFIFGELGLDGRLKDTNSIFPLILSLAKQRKIKKVVIPKASLAKISKIPLLEILAIDTLQEAIDFFRKEEKFLIKSKPLNANFIEVNGRKYYYSKSFDFDFDDIKAQEMAKRACLISASGMHNIVLEGSPGSGKSMSIKRLRYILPPMSIEEILEVARLKSLEKSEPDFIPVREFRSPHHSSTRASIFGGGSRMAKIGEVALANGGVLFFDEFPHFPKIVLESLREPLEDHKVLISRVNSKVKYETKFIFAGAMNPCPCGYLFSKINECRCNEIEIKRYKSAISAPLLDRIELFVKMDEIDRHDKSSISSKQMYEKVIMVFKAQKLRGQRELNGKLSEKEVKRFCKIDEECENILFTATQRFGMSHRGVNSTLKVARTIADLEESQNITKSHILEALSFRRRN